MKKLIILFFLLTTLAFSKDINIGDKINLEVNGVSQNQIQEGFKNSKLELDDIKKIGDDKFLVSFRSFETGEQEVILGNKKVLIDVKSVITQKDKEIQRDLSDLSNKKLYISKFPYVFIISLIAFLGSLIFIIKSIKLPTKTDIVDPEKVYANRMQNINDENWGEYLSLAIREYIDSSLNTHFLNGFYEVNDKIDAKDIILLNTLDEYKFGRKDKNLKKKYIEKIQKLHDKIRGDENV